MGSLTNLSDSRQYALSRIKRMADNYTFEIKDNLQSKLESVEDLRGSVTNILQREEKLNN